jgi:hypothetical protein
VCGRIYGCKQNNHQKLHWAHWASIPELGATTAASFKPFDEPAGLLCFAELRAEQNQSSVSTEQLAASAPSQQQGTGELSALHAELLKEVSEPCP